MSASSPIVWLTRPAEDSTAMAEILRTRGIHSLIGPVMQVEPLPPQAEYLETPTPHALLLTSRHAAYALAFLPESWRTLTVFCVGNATASAARHQQFTHIVEGDADALALLPEILAYLPTQGRLLHFTGADSHEDLRMVLQAQGFLVETKIVYQAIATGALEPELREAIAEHRVAAASFFSPRSTRLVMGLLHTHGLEIHAPHITALCLSLKVAEAAGALPWRSIRTCHRPTRDAMLDLIVSSMS